jgi:1-deoxy-D-xylulose-5-phosphate reductoisomerase
MRSCSSNRRASIVPVAVCINDPAKANELRGTLGVNCQVYSGAEGLLKLATHPDADIVLIAIVGTAGLQPALAAIRAGKDIAVASKEILVMAGETVMSEAANTACACWRWTASIRPSSNVSTASRLPPSANFCSPPAADPFRDKTAWPKEKFSEITVERALKHPSWVMGRKITIDSATLFNKGLEMIEARWLFDIEMARVGVVVHPQSIVHSMVEFVDGSLLAQLSTPDMCLPIQYALTYPDRAASERVQTDFPKVGSSRLKSRMWSDFRPWNWLAEQGRLAARCRQC